MTRSVQPRNPARGFFAQLEQQFFPGWLGNDDSFKRTSVDFRYYQKMWKGAILASQLQGTFNYGKHPPSMVSLMGGSYAMRGYYEGRYRDNDLIQFQVEYRQKIYNRHGIVAWGEPETCSPTWTNSSGNKPCRPTE